MRALISTFTNIRKDEVLPVFVSGLFFFCVLTALMVVRPAREALGMARGIEAIRWLFLGTVMITLAVNPLFGWLVSHFRRMVFIAATYLFFVAGLLIFYGLLVWAPENVGQTSGQIFYVWFSVFNLFATMLFWALMTDRFTPEQSERLFGAVALGGTLGAIFGPWLASLLAKPMGTPFLLPVAAVFLILAVLSAWYLTRLRDEVITQASTTSTSRSLIGGGAWEGCLAVFKSPYLLGISAYVLIVAVMATLIYFTRLHMVAKLGLDTDSRTEIFARIDMISQIATFALQALLTGHLMRKLGVAITLALLPISVALGFIGLAIFASLGALIALDATFKAMQRGVMRPARETLFTVLSRSDRYKSKAFIDTFVYRAGDVIGSQADGLLKGLGMGLAGLAGVAVPLALIWMGLGLWLGHARKNQTLTGDNT
ncbi:MFS transporter [Orrella sp. NBD-18]|uniref:MFS transporter n=1 Tax=Sheuella amnicola TaxID=2707330 RepID=A0A6B2R1N0_9BURK|nr:MFS transporter [Sheuella amnicola]NDY84013.1 MFS transporter [Sheuella amnicola]